VISVKAQKSPVLGQTDLFRSRLENLVDHNHELVLLAEKINWPFFDDKFGRDFSDDNGRPALRTRLMVGLQYLKYIYNESDEDVVKRFLENPYWQFFCGNEYFEHDLPCHPTSIVRWRKRLGVKGAEKMLLETIELAKRANVVSSEDLTEVYVDTTVQPKNIAYPTDAALTDTVRRALVRFTDDQGIKLRQTYKRLGRKSLQLHIRLKHSKDHKGARKHLRKLRTYLGRVIRNIKRKVPSPSGKLAHLLDLAQRIYSQRTATKGKVYSVHAPEVQCIAKGKAHKPYEFGSKVSIATTVKSNLIVSVHSFVNNPFDGHTISDVLCQIKTLVGEYPKAAYCDRGYKGSSGTIFSTNVFLQGSKKEVTDKIKQRLRSRSAIEPVIGHIKSDHRMGRNFLLGFQGDQINALMAGCAFNMKKILRALLFLIFSALLKSKYVAIIKNKLKNDHFRRNFAAHHLAVSF
jgi:IS5 family transposase